MNVVEHITRLPECLQAKVLQAALTTAADLYSFLLICKATNTMLDASLWREMFAAQHRHPPDNVDLLELKTSYFKRGYLCRHEDHDEKVRERLDVITLAAHASISGRSGIDRDRLQEKQNRGGPVYCQIYGVPSGLFSLSIALPRFVSLVLLLRRATNFAQTKAVVTCRNMGIFMSICQHPSSLMRF